MKTIFKHTLLSLAFLAGVFTAQAQVKIGTAPTVIGTNSNLEVEAAGGQKVIVNKTVGTVQVDNLPSGAILDSIVTQDPTTKILRRINPDKLLKSLNLLGPSKLRGGVQPLPQGSTKVNFLSYDFDGQGGADLVGDKFIIQHDGYYSYHVKQTVNIPGSPGVGVGGWGITLSASNGLNEYYNTPGFTSGITATDDMSNMAYFPAGTVIEVYSNPCGGCSSGNNGYSIVSTTLSITRNF